jgi:Ankyrin repeats (3 copies)
MTIADDIFNNDPDGIERHLARGELLSDIDEYGLTPLIETVVTHNLPLAQFLHDKGADIHQPDSLGRAALHWAVDFNYQDMCEWLLNLGADANAYNRAGQPVLTYPMLRGHTGLKKLLYQHGADLKFAQDFINAKLIGHRYELTGDVDIITHRGEFIEVDFEGFFLEFSIDMIGHSLWRFKQNFAARHLRGSFDRLARIIDGFVSAGELLKYQQKLQQTSYHQPAIDALLQKSLLILPVAYAGHAITFIKCGRLWAKCDRGENSQKEGTVNIYYITELDKCHPTFLRNMLFQRISEEFVHRQINEYLGLQPVAKLPLTPQISGNCSWANVEGAVASAYFLLLLYEQMDSGLQDVTPLKKEALNFYQQWQQWDQDRALNECIQSFRTADAKRKASKAAILGAVLFQACDYGNESDMIRAEQILQILTIPQYRYILDSYVTVYCNKRLTKRGNNLLHLLDDAGIKIATTVHPYPSDSIK